MAVWVLDGFQCLSASLRMNRFDFCEDMWGQWHVGFDNQMKIM